MALSNLRPGLTVTQRRVTVAPNVQTTTLPALFVGLNRDIVFQASAGIADWTSGTSEVAVPFPGFTSGVVEAGVANPDLVPRFFVNSSFGTAEITDSVIVNDLATGTPSFDIPSGVSADFSIAASSEGCFKFNTSATDLNPELFSQFLDPSADFVFSQVRRGDRIQVNGVSEFFVTDVLSDTELTAYRIGKGPEGIADTEASKLRLYPEDANDFRILEATSQAFIDAGGFGQSGTRVKGGDVVRFNNWETNVSLAGMLFGFVGEGAGDLVGAYELTAADRKVTIQGAAAVALADGAAVYDGAGTGLVVFTAENDVFVPAMYSVSASAAGEFAARDFSSNVLPDALDSDSGAAFEIIEYTPVASAAGSTGQFTAEDGSGQRTFTDLTGTPFASVAATNHILIQDTDGIYRPIFRVLTVTSDNELVVEEIRAGELPGPIAVNNVTYVISGFNPVDVESGGFATVSATESTLAGTVDVTDFGAYVAVDSDRLITAANADFSTGVAVNDLVFSDTGTLMFRVTAVPTSTSDKLIVTLAHNAANQLASSGTIDNFGFTIRNGNKPADYVVRRVISDSQVEVQERSDSLNSIPGTASIQGMISFVDPDNLVSINPASITVPNVVTDIDYTVLKTVSGDALRGDILVSYATVRNDLVGLTEINVQNYESIVGPAIPDNPLGLAAELYFSNASSTAYAIQVQEDTTAGWIAAAEAAKSDDVYQIVPLTNDAETIGLWQAHVVEQSQAANKRERILWQSFLFQDSVTRATWELTDNAMVSRDAAGVQTVVVSRDLPALGVVVGDDFVGTTFNGASFVDFTGRITDVLLSGTDTTLGIIPDGNIALSTTDLVLTDFTITSRPLNATEKKNEAAAYPSTVNSRRIRNIYPDQVQIEFDDTTGDGETTGFYGGGSQISTEGAYFVGALESAKRTVFTPATPLTKRGSTGIYKVLDTFAENPSFQDELIDAGHYYMEQQAGEGSNAQPIRALTTNVTDLTEAEESITPQIDNFVRRLRAQLLPFLGPEILDQRFFDIISTNAQAVVTQVLRDKELREIQLLEIKPSATAADTFELRYQITPFFSGARGFIEIIF